jgi:hypothetical protein
VARALEQDTDLVEAIVQPDAVDELDVQLGSEPAVFLLLTETPRSGFGDLVTKMAESAYAKSRPHPFEMVVRDKDGTPHPFSDSAVNEQSIGEHLKLASFGEPGDRRPFLRE